MFGSSQPSPYETLINSCTAETLTAENWELILELCDKITEDTINTSNSATAQTAAAAVISGLLKRLAHRNPNVQLYTLSLAEALSKNCGPPESPLRTEINSRAWCTGLEKVVLDRNTHDKVRKRVLGLMGMWVEEFSRENDEGGIMEDTLRGLEAKNYRPPPPDPEPLPPSVDDERRRQEEEELQRVLELSVTDKGGRAGWVNAYPSDSGAGSSSAGATSSSAAAAAAGSSRPGYVPARTPSPKHAPPPARVETFSAPRSSTPQQQEPKRASTPSSAGGVGGTALGVTTIVTRVKALHTFTPTEPGELAFNKDDVIKVVDRNYPNWWRGQLRGRTGIFPVNYVVPLPEPTEDELTREALEEARVFSEAVSVERLLEVLKKLEKESEEAREGGATSRDESFVENDEVQELYRRCMSLRPKIVRLIEKYSQKRADLVSLNESYMRAKTIFDRMMEESLAKSGIGGAYPQSTYPQGAPGPYPWNPNPQNQPAATFPTPSPAPAAYPQYQQPAHQAPYNPQQAQQGQYQPGGQAGQTPAQAQSPAAVGYGYGPQGQGLGPQPYPPVQQQGQPATGYPQQGPGTTAQQQQYPGQQAQAYPQHAAQAQTAATYQGAPTGQQQGTPVGTPYSHPQQQAQTQTQAYPQQQQQQQQPAAGATSTTSYPHQQQQQQQPAAAATSTTGYPHQQQQQPAAGATSTTSYLHQQQPYSQAQSPTPTTTSLATDASQQQQQPNLAIQNATPSSPTASAPPPAAAQQEVYSGPPPYPFSLTATYTDPNVQAWREYYKAGGKDPSGAVYFFSVPGVKEASSAQPANAAVSGSGTGAAAATASQGVSGGGAAQGLPTGGEAALTETKPNGAVVQERRSFDSLPQHHLPEPSAQQRPVTSYFPETTSGGAGGLPVLGGAVSVPQSLAVAAQPVGAAQPIGGGGGGGVQSSPAQGSSVPSWVLPKSNTPAGGGHHFGGSRVVSGGTAPLDG